MVEEISRQMIEDWRKDKGIESLFNGELINERDSMIVKLDPGREGERSIVAS
jgi:hypothetical protein